MLPNGPQYFIAFYAILKAGAIVVPVNPSFKHDELSHELLDSEPTVMFTQEHSLDVLGNIDAAAALETIVGCSRPTTRPPRRESGTHQTQSMLRPSHGTAVSPTTSAGRTLSKRRRGSIPNRSTPMALLSSTTPAAQPGCPRAAPTHIAT